MHRRHAAWRRTAGRKIHRSKRANFATLEQRRLLAGDLIAQWLADDLRVAGDGGPAVAEWVDSISGIVATANGQPELASGVVGGRSAVRFQPTDGEDSFRVRAADNPLAGANDFSVAIAFRTDSQALQGANDRWFENTGLVDSNGMGITQDWGISINASAQLSAGMGSGFGGTPDTLYSSSAGLNDGEMHVAVVTRGGTTLSVYVDDTSVDQHSEVSDQPRAPLDLTFGRQTSMSASTLS